ncbi:MAG: LAGLIDADG family homing endonuclease [bacterium]
MSNNATSADNQQGSLTVLHWNDPSETTRRTPLRDKTIKAYFLGALHDGTFSSNKRFRISQKGKNWLKILKRLLREIDYSSWIYKEGKDRDVYVLETLAPFLDFKFNPENLRTKDEIKSYIRGFFDAEGGIPKSEKDRFYIQLTQNDRTKLRRIKNLLNKLGIETGKIHNPSKRVDPEYWRMYVLSKSHKDFVKKIGSFHPRKLKTLTKRMMI